jgi:hypothetical protein
MSSHRTIQLVLASALVVLVATPAFAADDKNCKIVERDASQPDNSGTLSSSVTAGSGKVTGQTSGGNSVTMQSGNGSVSSSVTTTGSGGRHQTVVTNSDGSCTIYRDKEK